MKESEFEKTAIDILGMKFYYAFDSVFSKIAKECAVKLFLDKECNTKRANLIQEFIKTINQKGWMEWDKEEN